ncbi:MAG: ABC transporter substrate-binding protein, partial [Candidatus Caldarchaeum sp.]
MNKEKPITRRQAITNTLAAGAIVGVGIVAGVGGYFLGSSSGTRVETVTRTVAGGAQTVTAMQTVTRTVTGARSPPRDRILIGASISLTGGLAGFGTEQKWALEEVFKQVNADGGVYLMGYDRKLPIEFIVYDSKSEIPTVLANIEKLINVDKVDLLIGETGSHIGL